MNKKQGTVEAEVEGEPPDTPLSMATGGLIQAVTPGSGIPPALPSSSASGSIPSTMNLVFPCPTCILRNPNATVGKGSKMKEKVLKGGVTKQKVKLNFL